MKKIFSKSFILLLVLFAVTCLWALSTINNRTNIGKYGEPGDRHIWLSASSLKFANNWYLDGINTDSFLLIENFKSIEFEANEIKDNLVNRTIYSSYPSGSIIPLWVLAITIGRELKLLDIMYFVSFYQKL